MSEDLKTVVLGDEYDENIREALDTVLKKNRATSINQSWGVGGSQEIEITEIKFGDEVITVESETFVGLSITGPSRAVENLARQVREQLKGLS